MLALRILLADYEHINNSRQHPSHRPGAKLQARPGKQSHVTGWHGRAVSVPTGRAGDPQSLVITLLSTIQERPGASLSQKKGKAFAGLSGDTSTIGLVLSIGHGRHSATGGDGREWQEGAPGGQGEAVGPGRCPPAPGAPAFCVHLCPEPAAPQQEGKEQMCKTPPVGVPWLRAVAACHGRLTCR